MALPVSSAPPPPVAAATEEAVQAHFAAGRFDLIQQAIEEGDLDPNLPCQRPVPCALIHVAATKDAVDLLRHLVLKCGVDPNQRTRLGWSPVMMAIAARKEAAALWLISEAPGLEPDVRGPLNSTALIHAAAAGMVEVMDALLAKGAAIEARDNNDHTALVHAVHKKQEEAAVYLVEQAGADWEPSESYSMLDVAQLPGVLKAILGRMQMQEAATTPAAGAAGAAAAPTRGPPAAAGGSKTKGLLDAPGGAASAPVAPSRSAEASVSAAVGAVHVGTAPSTTQVGAAPSSGSMGAATSTSSPAPAAAMASTEARDNKDHTALVHAVLGKQEEAAVCLVEQAGADCAPSESYSMLDVVASLPLPGVLKAILGWRQVEEAATTPAAGAAAAFRSEEKEEETAAATTQGPPAAAGGSKTKGLLDAPGDAAPSPSAEASVSAAVGAAHGGTAPSTTLVGSSSNNNDSSSSSPLPPMSLMAAAAAPATAQTATTTVRACACECLSDTSPRSPDLPH